jgi:hypothetical protein
MKTNLANQLFIRQFYIFKIPIDHIYYLNIFLKALIKVVGSSRFTSLN